MENKDSSEESGEMICSELDVPIMTSEALEPVVTAFLSAITEEQWMLLADGKINCGAFSQLYKMCSEILKNISSEVLEVVEPQVHNWMLIHATQDGHNMKNRNYYSLTEDDIKASIGNSLDCCFGAVTGIPQERSNASVALLELIAAEVKKRVNKKLAGLVSSAGQSASCPQTAESETSDDDNYGNCEMVLQVATVLNRLLRNDTESPSHRDTLSSMEKFCLEELCIIFSIPLDVKCHVMKNVGDMILEDFCSPSPNSSGSSDTASEGTSPSKEQMLDKLSRKNRGSRHKVRTFFNRKTSKVAPACDLNTSVSRSCVTRPDSKETLVNSSSELLNNYPPQNRRFGHNLSSFISRRTSKVTPGCDPNTYEGQGRLCRVLRKTFCPDEITEAQEFCSEDSVTPACDKLSGIMRILSSTAKVLMKPFTCCMRAE